MLREYQLTNFKAFAGPETMPIRPITLIYGPNSSGKSSILQSLLLLKQTLEEADASTTLLPKGSLVDLGSYREFVHRHEVEKKFSFKALFPFGEENVKSKWAKDIVKAAKPGLAELEVVFACDQETSVVSTVNVFIGDKSLPLVKYPYFIGPKGPFSESLFDIKINPEHNFWRAWWSATKEYIEGQLLDASFIVYVGRDGKVKVATGYGEYGDFQKSLEDYSFEEAIRDLEEPGPTSFLISQSPFRKFLKKGREL
jgi:hypothetical protein